VENSGDGVGIGDVEDTHAAAAFSAAGDVAETLTGWANAEAMGQPLDAVFRIVNEETRQSACLMPFARAGQQLTPRTSVLRTSFAVCSVAPPSREIPWPPLRVHMMAGRGSSPRVFGPSLRQLRVVAGGTIARPGRSRRARHPRGQR